MSLSTLQWHLGTESGPVLDEDLLRVAREAAQSHAQLLIALGDVRHFESSGSTGPHGSTVARLQAELSRHAPQAQLVGCSTAGEIIGSRVHAGSLVITAVRLDGGSLLVNSLPVDSMEQSQSVGQSLSHALLQQAQQQQVPLRHLWILAPGVEINGSALVEGLRNGLSGTELPGISGGLAGDGGAFRRTWTVGPAGVQPHHVVAVGLCAQDLVSGSSADGGWEAFGPARRVTQVQGNRLDEMDHEPALTIYRRYLGEYAKDLPASGLLFPLQITSGPEKGLIRTILGIDETRGGLILAGDVPADAQVRLMHASTSSLVAAAEMAAQRLDAAGCSGGQSLALLVSCIGRRLVMGDQTDEEVEAVCDALPPGTRVTGFYSNGEIAAWNFTGDCRLHNQTMTITWLSASSASSASAASPPSPAPSHGG